MRDCISIGIVQRDEPPCVYMLEDGSRITVRTIVNEIWRVEGEFDAEGNAMYLTKAGGAITVTSPPELRRKDQ
jgi:hypothetical protein